MTTTRLTLSPLAILFDVDGCLISTGGAGTKACRRAFERLHGHALNPARMLVMGDTPRDIEAGRAVGAVTVGVATGKYTVQELGAAGADYVLPTLESPLPGIDSLTSSSF